MCDEVEKKGAKSEQDVRRDPPFMHHGRAACDNDFFVNYQVAYETAVERVTKTLAKLFHAS